MDRGCTSVQSPRLYSQRTRGLFARRSASGGCTLTVDHLVGGSFSGVWRGLYGGLRGVWRWASRDTKPATMGTPRTARSGGGQATLCLSMPGQPLPPGPRHNSRRSPPEPVGRYPAAPRLAAMHEVRRSERHPSPARGHLQANQSTFLSPVRLRCRCLPGWGRRHAWFWGWVISSRLLAPASETCPTASPNAVNRALVRHQPNGKLAPGWSGTSWRRES